jgi:response regulator RpfG family c-di-GMP phosphodiesterase/GGDEF domain-containing protein
MSSSQRTLGAAPVALGLLLIAVMSVALAAMGGAGAWIVPLLGGTVLGVLVVLAGVSILGVSKAVAVAEQESYIDPVTALPNAEKLAIDLHRARSTTTSTFSLHLLEGFKSYSEAYGRGCGDALLAWLAQKLRRAVAGDAIVYRMRGGEFALLATGDATATENLRQRVEEALRESGEGFVIDSFAGYTELPSEAKTVTDALRLADHRASAERRSSEREAEAQLPDDAFETTRVGSTGFEVVELATQVGRRFGLPADRLDDLAAASHLRDVGNMAIPSGVLANVGDLNAAEWRFIRLHTMVGERLLSANFGMEHVGELVRSSHERWDGGGYPDGLAGDDIPFGARVVFVCTAFEDMISGRPHRAALSVEDALEQLTLGAGSQFDPEVVRAFGEAFAMTGSETPTLLSAIPPQRLRVLVADDDAASRFLLWRAIDAAGHECVTVNNGYEALQTFRRELPDIVICDARLPEIDGNELCRLIRSEPQARDAYFVLITALGELSLVARRGAGAGAGAGVDEFLTKPISRSELDQRLAAAARAANPDGAPAASAEDARHRR